MKKSYIEDINNKKRLKSTILHVLSTCSECPVNKSLEKPKNVFVCDVVSQIGLKITNTENSCDLTEDSLSNAFVYENNPIKSEKNCISEHEMSDNDKIDPRELSDGEYLDEQISSNKLKEKSKKKSKKESNLTISSLSKNVKKSSKTRKYKKHNWVEKTLRLRKSKVINLSIDEQMKELEDRKTSKDFHHAKYKCEFCVKVFPYSESLENHMLRHNEVCFNLNIN